MAASRNALDDYYALSREAAGLAVAAKTTADNANAMAMRTIDTVFTDHGTSTPVPHPGVQGSKIAIAFGTLGYVVVLAILIGWAIWWARSHARREAWDPEWTSKMRRLDEQGVALCSSDEEEEAELETLRPPSDDQREDSSSSRKNSGLSRKGSASSISNNGDGREGKVVS